jgi:DNA polymerase
MRTQTVFGTGTPTARLMFVGEAPGADEDRTGQPFVGRAGQLLTDMITKGMGLTRDQVYIANVLKSRPPENRTPLPDEVAHCLPYLERQIAIIRPEFLCLLGATAAQALLETALSVGRLRGRWHRYRGIATLVTYHPSYLLRNPPAKKDAWEDLQILMQAMGLKAPERKKG